MHTCVCVPGRRCVHRWLCVRIWNQLECVTPSGEGLWWAWGVGDLPASVGFIRVSVGPKGSTSECLAMKGSRGQGLGRCRAALKGPSDGGWDPETSGFPTQPGACHQPAHPHHLAPAPGAVSGGRKTLKELLDWACRRTWAWRAGFGMRGCSPCALCPGDLALPPEVCEGWPWVEGLEIGGQDFGSKGGGPDCGGLQVNRWSWERERGQGKVQGGGDLYTWLISECGEVHGGLTSTIGPAAQHVLGQSVCPWKVGWGLA